MATVRGQVRTVAALALAVAGALMIGTEADARKGNRGVERVASSYHEEHWGDWSVTTYQNGQEVYEGGGYRSSYDSYDDYEVWQ